MGKNTIFILIFSVGAVLFSLARAAGPSPNEWDGTTHFNMLLDDPNLHAAFALRSQTEINEHTAGSLGLGEDNPDVTYDPILNAAKVTLAGATLDQRSVVRIPFQSINKTTGDNEVSLQWEAYYPHEFTTAWDGQASNSKVFQIANTAGSVRDARRIEFQMRWLRTDSTAVALPTVRVYHMIESGGNGESDPLTRADQGYYDWQPGGDTTARYKGPYNASVHMSGTPERNAFLILPDRWIRFTASITFNAAGDGKQRFKLWMSDENTPPALVIADPDDPNLGFIIDATEANSGTNEFWLEFNSSQNRTGPPLDAWVRNIAVFKNKTVPCGIGTPCGVEPDPSPPVIINQSADQTVEAGTPASFLVSAIGYPFPTYQWQKDGENIPDASGSRYEIASAQWADAGEYRCVVTNNLGTVTSDAATLTVQSAGGSGRTYYVSDSEGLDSNSGTSPGAAWQSLGKVSAETLTPGDTVLFKRGDTFSGELKQTADGTAAEPITFGAYGTGERPVLRQVDGRGDYHIYQDLIVDHNQAPSDRPVWIRGKQNIFRNMEVRNALVHGVNVVGADGLLIEDSHFHHFLAGSFSDQQDAHGISIEDTQGLTVRNTQINHVSGDSLQADPDRDTDTTTDILIEGCHFWTGPLETDMGLWNAGEQPGENAIDTKNVKSNWESVPRMKFTIRDTVAHGWTDAGYITNTAVFNMKEKIEAVFEGVTVYDSDIAFRLRGARGNADTTIANAVIYDVERAIRAEDDLANLKVYHATFGDGIGKMIERAGGKNNADWDWKSNLFVGSKPSEAAHTSNVIAQSTDFKNAGTRDYHLAEGSIAIDAGTAISGVSIDRDGRARPAGNGYDAGAYEYGASPPENQAPTVNAGADQTVTLPDLATLRGSASDDGKPNPPGKLTTAWRKISGAGGVTFGDPGALRTTAEFSEEGIYVLELSADDGEKVDASVLTVTVKPAPGGPGGTDPDNPILKPDRFINKITRAQAFQARCSGPIDIYNQQGERVKTVRCPGSESAGSSAAGDSSSGGLLTESWNAADDLPSGTYFFTGPGGTERKFVVVK